MKEVVCNTSVALSPGNHWMATQHKTSASARPDCVNSAGPAACKMPGVAGRPLPPAAGRPSTAAPLGNGMPYLA